jgi:hypothetical protein
VLKRLKFRGIFQHSQEEGIFEECNAEAIKNVLAFQLEKELKKQKITILKQPEKSGI